MNWKKPVGIGLIVLGALGAAELGRKAVNHYQEVGAADRDHYKATQVAGDFAFNRNQYFDLMTGIMIKAEQCHKFNKVNNCKLDDVCSALDQAEEKAIQEYAKLNVYHRAALETVEREKKRTEYHSKLTKIDLAGTLFSAVMGIFGVGLLYRKEKEAKEKK